MSKRDGSSFITVDDIRNNKSLVVKSNYLVEASYSLSTQEQRIILILASLVKPDEQDFHRYKIEVKEFNRLVGIKNESGYAETKEVTKKLLKRVVVIKNIADKTELQIGWLASAEYFDGKGYIELEFSPKLKPYFLALKECFTQYQLKNVIALKRSYSIRIYELLKQYEKIGERYFEIDHLKYILGIEEDKYKYYGHFKDKVINPAKKELNNKTDIYFDFKEKKKARKVIGLYFFIKRHEKEPHDQKIDDINIEIYMRMKDYFCLSPTQAKEFLNKYPESRIIENLQHVERRHKLGQIKDMGAYTVKAIKENIKDQLSLFDEEKQKRDKIKSQEEAQKQLREHLKKQYRIFRQNEHEKLRKSLSEAKLKEIKDQANINGKEKAGNKQYGLKMFQCLAEEKILDELGNIPSEEEWINQEKARCQPLKPQN